MAKSSCSWRSRIYPRSFQPVCFAAAVGDLHGMLRAGTFVSNGVRNAISQAGRIWLTTAVDCEALVDPISSELTTPLRGQSR